MNARRDSYEGIFTEFTSEDGDGPVVAVKDLIDVKGLRTTWGVARSFGEVASADATIVQAVRVGGGCIIGKTNMHPLAMGASGINAAYGTARNPYDYRRVAGGSSSGSAAAVARGYCDWALGTDSGGSIRIPAALCGVWGMRPGVGSLPMNGVKPVSPTFDVVGPLAPSYGRLREAYAVLARGELEPVEGALPARVVRPSSEWIGPLDSDVGSVWAGLVPRLKEVELPSRELMLRVQSTILLREFSRWHDSDDLHRYPISRSILSDIARGRGISAEEYREALGVRDALLGELGGLLAEGDLLVLPATQCTAPRVREAEGRRRSLTALTRAISLTGRPVVCVPIAVPGGLPIGVQVVGHVGGDAQLLRAIGSFLELLTL